MERRTFESHMEWEYQNKGPLDHTSPFAQVGTRRKENLFSSPLKPTPQHHNFAPFGTPSKPPSSSHFTPQISARAAAPPFRNPAFTTPRKFDDTALSEVEESPAPTEASDFPNDTPEADRMSDVTMGSPISPLKIDKQSRYSRSPKKHMSGKGEIRSLRESPRKELQVLRKRKRHNFDRDVSSVSRQLYREWDDVASDSDESITEFVRSQNMKRHGKNEPWLGNVLHRVERYQSAPDSIYQWLQLGLNTCFISFVVFCGYSVIQAVRSDIRNANEKARLEIMSRSSKCENHYIDNECSKRDRPALRVVCDEWYDCMMQDSDAIMRVKVTAKQLAEIINEFTDAMNMKAWGFFFAVVLIVIFTNFLGRYTGNSAPKAAPPAPIPFQPVASHMSSIAPEGTPAHMRSRFQTPRTQRYRMIEDDGTDDDNTPPKLAPAPLLSFTPSGRRSPSKGERPRSPIKYLRSPSKGY
ncbi:hypothetical protein PT974_01615 [Cladobotryum mycophilum]|uniref:Brl1/Brr6 domain-containing protein n=1 Tax=Cladobotryum mycophilum TaxID=491253 RepID=A0ABR0T487_9HYPO